MQIDDVTPVLGPVDYHVVREAFTSLVQAAWFHRTDASVGTMARIVISNYTAGMTSVELLAKSEPSARIAFGHKADESAE